MSEGPTFDEIIGAEPTGAERERLRHVHELLVEAGPPPELDQRLAKPPEVDNVRALFRPVKRRATLALIAAALAATLFAVGYGVGHRSDGSNVVQAIPLKGTKAAPNATATLEVDHQVSGNWPMTLTVRRLPKLPAHSLYEVYLVRDGKPWGSCGTFVVGSSSQTISVPLNAPYRLHKGDTWIVTRESSGTGPGTTVLRPAV